MLLGYSSFTELQFQSGLLKLEWTTLSETDNDRFVVQGSAKWRRLDRPGYSSFKSNRINFRGYTKL